MNLSLLRERPVLGWVLYDWGNSAFALTVVATFFPVFFHDYWAVGGDAALITSRYSLGIAAASLGVALIAPVLGAIADAGGARKRFLLGFTLLAAAATLGLYFVEQGGWAVALGLYGCALFGFYAANTFYDSLLLNVTRRAHFESVSAMGFGLGYLGSALLLAFNLWMVDDPARFGFADAAEAVRVAFALVAVWWLIFTVPVLLFVPEQRRDSPSFGSAIIGGYRSLARTLRALGSYRNLGLFLLAYWLYIDGVHTLILMAVDFGKRLQFDSNALVLAILVTNIVGVPATLAYGWLGNRIGAKRAIMLGVSVYLLMALWALTLESLWQFYAMAAGIGLVQGGVQSMSRALYARLVPPERAAEFFGFYSMLGKFAAILGPLMIGLLARVSDDPRVAVFALLPLYIGGLLLLARVEVPSGEAAARE